MSKKLISMNYSKVSYFKSQIILACGRYKKVAAADSYREAILLVASCLLPCLASENRGDL